MDGTQRQIRGWRRSSLRKVTENRVTRPEPDKLHCGGNPPTATKTEPRKRKGKRQRASFEQEQDTKRQQGIGNQLRIAEVTALTSSGFMDTHT